MSTSVQKSPRGSGGTPMPRHMGNQADRPTHGNMSPPLARQVSSMPDLLTVAEAVAVAVAADCGRIPSAAADDECGAVGSLP